MNLSRPTRVAAEWPGPFGFEKEKYEVSQAIGERVLLPAVRQASADTLIVSDGFSCREQIAQATGRRALHLAEVLEMALRIEKGRAAAGRSSAKEPGTPGSRGE